VQNHCYAKHVCGRGGECMNFGLTYRCRCNFLYRGRKCDKCKLLLNNFDDKKIFFLFLVSSKAVQSIIALMILILMVLVACCLKFNIYSYCQIKKKYVNIYLE